MQEAVYVKGLKQGKVDVYTAKFDFYTYWVSTQLTPPISYATAMSRLTSGDPEITTLRDAAKVAMFSGLAPFVLTVEDETLAACSQPSTLRT